MNVTFKTVIKQYIPALRARDEILYKIDEQNSMISDLDAKNEYLFWLSQHRAGETMLETKKRVFLEMPKADGDIRDFQIVANYILQRTKKICDENGLQFFLSGGTLLGAVRHHGFIPWDDDVDVMMFREDFKRLEELLAQDNKIVLQRCYCKYPQGVGAYVDKIKMRGSEQFFVDVFPMDIFYSNRCDIETMWEETKQLSYEYYREIEQILDESGVEFYRSMYPEAKPQIDSKVKLVEDTYLKKFNKIFNEGGQYAYLTRGIEQGMWLREDKKIRKVEDWLPLIKDNVEFEGEKYSTVQNVDNWLKLEYGDYWGLPRSINQTHSNELSNLSQSDVKIINQIKSI